MSRINESVVTKVIREQDAKKLKLNKKMREGEGEEEEEEDTDESESESESEDEKVSTVIKDKNTNSINLSTKEKYYYIFIKKFFRELDPKKIDKMLNIVNEKSKISLRQLDWFVTRYSNKNIKNKKVAYKLKDEERNDEAGNFNVHISYKAQLKSYRKKYFDPFRRRSKFYFYFNSDKTSKTSKRLLTTIGQLNFFRWAFQYEVIDYVEENYDEIANAMGVSNKEDKKRKSNASRRKKVNTNKTTVIKKNVNVTAKKEVDIENKEVKITVSFD